MFKLTTLALVLTLLFQFSCSRGEGKPAVKVKTPKKGNEFIKKGKKIDELSPYENYSISIDNKAMGKRFLMQSAFITGAPVVMGNSIAAKIVYFEADNDSVYLLEDTTGKLNNIDLPAEIQLADFPIIEKDKKTTSFNFNKGMKKKIVTEAMFVSDFRDENDKFDTILETDTSRVVKVEQRNEYIYIEQFVSYNEVTKEREIPKSGQFKYFFSVYEKDEEFEPVISNKNKKIGYFEAVPQLVPVSGDEVFRISKFKIREDGKIKPIVFHLSRNIPAKHLQAVKDGVLYWNQVFGEKIMQVETLPEGIFVHEPGYNIVQWIDWDGAGFAYAQAQPHPYTGKNLQSHVYMTSVFATHSAKNAEDYIKQLAALEKRDKIPSSKAFGLSYSPVSKICLRKHSTVLAPMASNLKKLTANLSDDEAKKIIDTFVNDYVREVVAHEIGHTLGLRHNFHGNLATTLKPSEYDQTMRDYFENDGDVPEHMVSASTVMDYVPTMMAVYNGARARLKQGGLEYDKAAIAWGYKGAKIKDLDVPLFCTDSHSMSKKHNYLDCITWDIFSNPIEDANWQIHNDIKSVAFKVSKYFEFLKDEKLSDEEKLDKVRKTALPIMKLLKRYIVPYVETLAKMASQEAEFISVRSDFDEVTGSNEEKYYSATKDFQKESFKSVEGIGKVLVQDIVAETSVVRNNGEERSTIKLIKDLQELTLNYFHNDYDDVALPEAKEIALEEIDNFLFIFERNFLLKYSKALQVTFAIKPNSNLKKDLTNFLTYTLFSHGPILKKHQGKSYYRYLYKDNTNLRNKSILKLRENLVELASFDFLPRYSFSDDIKKQLKKRHKSEMGELANAKDEVIKGFIDPFKSWLETEIKLFKNL